MRLVSLAPILTGVTLLANPAGAFDGSGIAGIYGDEQGRLGCSADGEHLAFMDDGRVVLFEHADDAGQTVGKYEMTDASGVAVELADPPGHVIQLSVQGTSLKIVGYTVSGVADQAQLDAWSNRHGAFVPCGELDR